MKWILLMILPVGLGSCAAAPPSAGYQKAKDALIEVITQDMKEGDS